MNHAPDDQEAEGRPGSLDGPVTQLPHEGETRIGRFATIDIAIWLLALIALIAALHLARAFFVPLLFGILVSYALRPIVDSLERFHVPRSVGAAMVLTVMVGGLGWMALSLSDDTQEIAEKLPDAARKLRHSLSTLHSKGSGTLHRVQEAAKELQHAAADAGWKSTEAQAGIADAPDVSARLRDFLLAQTTLFFAFAAQAPIVLLLTFFLLASGSHFRRKLVQFVGPSLTRKKDIVRILEEVEVQIQHYLFVMLISNVLVAVITWAVFAMLGLEHAAVWGVAAGILRFIPYLGAVTIAVGSGIAGLLQFGSFPQAISVAAASIVVSGLVGMVFMTWLQGRFARVNAAVLFIVLLFFGWLWGVAGLLLGAPLLAIVKVISDHVESLHPLGELLGP
jgi:predicted PurR-regulated permease PerM